MNAKPPSLMWKSVRKVCGGWVRPPVVVAVGAALIGTGMWVGNPMSHALGIGGGPGKLPMSVQTRVGVEGKGDHVRASMGTALAMATGAAMLPHPDKEHKG